MFDLELTLLMTTGLFRQKSYVLTTLGFVIIVDFVVVVPTVSFRTAEAGFQDFKEMRNAFDNLIDTRAAFFSWIPVVLKETFLKRLLMLIGEGRSTTSH